MAKKKREFEVGGFLHYRFDIMRVGKEGVTIQFADGTRKTIQEDDSGIEKVIPGPKPKGLYEDMR